MNKVIVLDTSVLCCLLSVPGKETCGSGEERLDHLTVKAKLKKAEGEDAIFVLPLASIIETGNHIAQARERRYETAKALAKIITDAADATTPWAAFTQQLPLWDAQGLVSLSKSWPDLAKRQLSLGDATIKNVAEYYAQMDYEVELFTGDQQLRAYQPVKTTRVPRRRK